MNHSNIDITVRHILKEQSKLAAVRWLKEQTGLSLTDAKSYVDKLEVTTTEGTISWFSVSELPSLGKDGFYKKEGWSDDLLMTAPARGIATGRCIIEIEAFRPSNGNWTPTHWAYINYPENIKP